MLSGIGFGELAVICIVLIIAVGPERLPSMMKTFGKTMRTLRQASREIRSATGIDELMRDDVLDMRPPVRKPAPPPGPAPVSRAEAPAPAPDAAAAAAAGDVPVAAPVPALASTRPSAPPISVPKPAGSGSVPPPSAAATPGPGAASSSSTPDKPVGSI